MQTAADIVTVSEAAALCRVGRTTVGYWIRSGKLFARRRGRNYAIPVEDLLYFLKSNRQPIPASLAAEAPKGPIYPRFQSCWDYWQDHGGDRNCDHCRVKRLELPDCFTLPADQVDCRRSPCVCCGYYQDVVAARIQFIHQIDAPATVFKHFSFWGGNQPWSLTCGVSEADLVGLGIERVVHPDSLAEVVEALKWLTLDRLDRPIYRRVAIFGRRHAKLTVTVLLQPLNEPPGTYLGLIHTVAPEQQPTSDG